LLLGSISPDIPAARTQARTPCYRGLKTEVEDRSVMRAGWLTYPKRH
jgi:hypothetical protein